MAMFKSTDEAIAAVVAAGWDRDADHLKMFVRVLSMRRQLKQMDEQLARLKAERNELAKQIVALAESDIETPGTRATPTDASGTSPRASTQPDEA
jgi:N-acyl-L-homoserine lactone synthetase